ncbi:hypothetical protein SAMN02744783_00491 [Serratia sp. CC22-02]|uniref:hypothetical protein n=1 Tax=Serratia sp. CC22-02 TaxID=1378076 RepID=UPI002402EBA8|nr:hypothetical protein [Serratia sp. CC22-02]SMP41372.1 hypothetical protein SAMN02744783_00491 [Serratia sp. CC22-02]
MTLTTEQLRARAKFWREKAVEAKWESVSIAQDMLQNADAFDELAANREAQPVAMGKFAGWGLYHTKSGEFGNWLKSTPESDNSHAISQGYANVKLYTAPPAPASTRPVAWEMRYWNSGYNMWHEWERITAEQHAEMSVQHATDNDYEFRVLYDAPPAPAVPDGFKLMPLEMTDEIGEAIAMEARCCGGIALCIYEAALAAAPEGGNDHDTRR